MCVIIGRGIGGKIIARTAVAGVSVLLSYEEKSLAAVNVKGQSELALLQKVDNDNNDGRSLCGCCDQ